MELVRLLHEAAEIEHSLMVQYLYAAFSIKPAYADLAGYGNPNANDLLGVAIQEMQHLSAVNELLAELGAAPVFIRQDFPYEPDIYPFPLNLEALSRKSLAKYTYTEAPAAALDRKQAKSAHDLLLIENLDAVLGPDARPNHIGSLYTRIIDTLREFGSSSKDFKDVDKWVAKCEDIKEEGEDGHFRFFKNVFMGTHAALGGQPSVWYLSPSHEDYPVLPLPTNPSAYVGHERQIQDPVSLSICWFGDLHYWLSLALLDFSFRNNSQPCLEAAQTIMMGPLCTIARFVPTRGVGLPFDNMSMGSAPGRDKSENTKFIAYLAQEAAALEKQLTEHLPEDYPFGLVRQTLDPIWPAPLKRVHVY
jgi:rubrerythrin